MKQKLLYVWDHFEEFLLVPSFAFSVVLVTVQVVMRYVFQSSLSWSEELTRYLYIWQTWLGVSYAAKKGSHLRITIFSDKLKGKARLGLEIFVTVVWIGFAIFVCYQGLSAIKTIATFGQKSSALRIPMQFCYASIPVGMVLMCIRLVEATVKNILNFKKDQEGGTAA